jgi:hypothetical protein
LEEHPSQLSTGWHWACSSVLVSLAVERTLQK